MSPVMAYIFGLFTALLILLPFYIASMWSNTASGAYLTAFCKQACTYPTH